MPVLLKKACAVRCTHVNASQSTPVLTFMNSGGARPTFQSGVLLQLFGQSAIRLLDGGMDYSRAPQNTFASHFHQNGGSDMAQVWGLDHLYCCICMYVCLARFQLDSHVHTG